MKMQIRTQQVGNGARDCASRTGFQAMLILLVSGPYLRSKRLGDYFRKALEPSVLSSPAWKWDSSGASLPASGCLKGKEARWCAGKPPLRAEGWGSVHMLRPQIMLTRQHCPPRPLGLKQEI